MIGGYAISGVSSRLKAIRGVVVAGGVGEERRVPIGSVVVAGGVGVERLKPIGSVVAIVLG